MNPVGSAKGKMGVSDPPSIRVKIASIRGHIMLEMERCFKLFSSASRQQKNLLLSVSALFFESQF